MLRDRGLLEDGLMDDYDSSLDTWVLCEEEQLEDLTNEDIADFKEQVQIGNDSHKIIIAYQDYFLISTEHPHPKRDAESDKRHASAFFDPRTTTIPNPSSVNPMDIFEDSDARNDLYERSISTSSPPLPLRPPILSSSFL